MFPVKQIFSFFSVKSIEFFISVEFFELISYDQAGKYSMERIL